MAVVIELYMQNMSKYKLGIGPVGAPLLPYFLFFLFVILFFYYQAIQVILLITHGKAIT